MDLISTNEAAALIGVSPVMMHKWRKTGAGPTVYPNETRTRFHYDRAECLSFQRDRMDPLDRFRDIEARLSALEGAGR